MVSRNFLTRGFAIVADCIHEDDLSTSGSDLCFHEDFLNCPSEVSSDDSNQMDPVLHLPPNIPTTEGAADVANHSTGCLTNNRSSIASVRSLRSSSSPNSSMRSSGRLASLNGDSGSNIAVSHRQVRHLAERNNICDPNARMSRSLTEATRPRDMSASTRSEDLSRELRTSDCIVLRPSDFCYTERSQIRNSSQPDIVSDAVRAGTSGPSRQPKYILQRFLTDREAFNGAFVKPHPDQVQLRVIRPVLRRPFSALHSPAENLVRPARYTYADFVQRRMVVGQELYGEECTRRPRHQSNTARGSPLKQKAQCSESKAAAAEQLASGCSNGNRDEFSDADSEQKSSATSTANTSCEKDEENDQLCDVAPGSLQQVVLSNGFSGSSQQTVKPVVPKKPSRFRINFDGDSGRRNTPKVFIVQRPSSDVSRVVASHGNNAENTQSAGVSRFIARLSSDVMSNSAHADIGADHSKVQDLQHESRTAADTMETSVVSDTAAVESHSASLEGIMVQSSPAVTVSTAARVVRSSSICSETGEEKLKREASKMSLQSNPSMDCLSEEKPCELKTNMFVVLSPKCEQPEKKLETKVSPSGEHQKSVTERVDSVDSAEVPYPALASPTRTYELQQSFFGMKPETTDRDIEGSTSAVSTRPKHHSSRSKGTDCTVVTHHKGSLENTGNENVKRHKSSDEKKKRSSRSGDRGQSSDRSARSSRHHSKKKSDRAAAAVTTSDTKSSAERAKKTSSKQKESAESTTHSSTRDQTNSAHNSQKHKSKHRKKDRQGTECDGKGKHKQVSTKCSAEIKNKSSFGQSIADASKVSSDSETKRQGAHQATDKIISGQSLGSRRHSAVHLCTRTSPHKSWDRNFLTRCTMSSSSEDCSLQKTSGKGSPSRMRNRDPYVAIRTASLLNARKGSSNRSLDNNLLLSPVSTTDVFWPTPDGTPITELPDGRLLPVDGSRPLPLSPEEENVWKRAEGTLLIHSSASPPARKAVQSGRMDEESRLRQTSL